MFQQVRRKRIPNSISWLELKVDCEAGQGRAVSLIALLSTYSEKSEGGRTFRGRSGGRDLGAINSRGVTAGFCEMKMQERDGGISEDSFDCYREIAALGQFGGDKHPRLIESPHGESAAQQLGRNLIGWRLNAVATGTYVDGVEPADGGGE